MTDSLYAKREKIQNRWITGFYQNIRVVTIWITLTIFFALPWLTWGERQAILFDLKHRYFYLFNITFLPQDFFLLSLLIIITALALIVITTLAGRIWCGYTCPQTVWTRLYMWVEYLIEGDRHQRLKRDRDPLQYATFFRRLAKHLIWLAIAFITATTFVGFFTPIRDLASGLATYQWNGMLTFWVSFFTLATYLNAGWMREQVCLHICPYARFQSVMFDKDTLIISYDYHRGEPRGARKIEANHTTDSALGDCIDCQLCVQVCPTGIDIRRGLQMACIGCAACIDACNQVMSKINYPQGLIRYHTSHGLEKQKTHILRPRFLASLLSLILMASIFVGLLWTRIPLRAEIIHDHQHLYRLTADGMIENSYILKLINMTQSNQTYKIRLDNMPNVLYMGEQIVSLRPGEIGMIPITLKLKKSFATTFKIPLSFHIQDTQHPAVQLEIEAAFFIGGV